MTPRAACEKSECLGSGGSMVNLAAIESAHDVELHRSAALVHYYYNDDDDYYYYYYYYKKWATSSNCGNLLKNNKSCVLPRRAGNGNRVSSRRNGLRMVITHNRYVDDPQP